MTFNIRDKGKEQFAYLIEFKQNNNPNISYTVAAKYSLQRTSSDYDKNISQSDNSVNNIIRKPDEEYATAIKNNDSATAQRMVNEAAERSGALSLEDNKIYSTNEVKNVKKVLDPITYGDNGNVIPLSQRFDSDVSDPRYSATANNAWQEHLDKYYAPEGMGKSVNELKEPALQSTTNIVKPITPNELEKLKGLVGKGRVNTRSTLKNTSLPNNGA